MHDVYGSCCSEVQSELRSNKARPPTKELFHNNSYARDDQGDNPGQEIKGSTVSSENCDRCRHLDWQRQGVSRADVAQVERCD